MFHGYHGQGPTSNLQTQGRDTRERDRETEGTRPIFRQAHQLKPTRLNSYGIETPAITY